MKHSQFSGRLSPPAVPPATTLSDGAQRVLIRLDQLEDIVLELANDLASRVDKSYQSLQRHDCGMKNYVLRRLYERDEALGFDNTQDSDNETPDKTSEPIGSPVRPHPEQGLKRRRIDE